MSMTAQPHLPLAPLLRATGANQSVAIYADGRKSVTPNPLTFLTRFGTASLVTVNRWSRSGIPRDSADQIACAAGFHPCEVWGDEWWEACK